MTFPIPQEIQKIARTLAEKNFQAWLVGGCVRDLWLGREPKDWDIATDAEPPEIQKIFSAFAEATADKPATIYENEFGTVGIKTNAENETLKIVEVTTFRIEGRYSDKRHPDRIKFAKTIEEDLARRDFTINAMALKIENLKLKIDIVDPFDGQKDLKNKIIRAVGQPAERFEEDALRLMRAVRLAVELDFKIETETERAAKEKSPLLQIIAKERIRDEFIKIIMAREAAQGVRWLEKYDLLRYVVPELKDGIDCEQNKHHIYTVFEHNIRALAYAAEKNYSLEIRLAALLHDVSKPQTKQGDGPEATFYNHEVVGAKTAGRIMDRLHFPKNLTEKIVHLVRCHLFYYNVGEVTEAGVRRFLSRVGPENVADLIKVREADRIGSGVPKAVPYKLRHLLFMIEKVKKDPIHPKMLAVHGEDVMEILKIQPGPKIGFILNILLEEILDDPGQNKKDDLESKIKELGKLSDAELQKLAEKAKQKKEEFESGVEEEIKKKFYVR